MLAELFGYAPRSSGAEQANAESWRGLDETSPLLVRRRPRRGEGMNGLPAAATNRSKTPGAQSRTSRTVPPDSLKSRCGRSGGKTSHSPVFRVPTRPSVSALSVSDKT